jgi:hypothetical protein
MEISRKHSGSLRVLSLYQCSSITDGKRPARPVFLLQRQEESER